MKSKIVANTVLNDDRWLENVDFDAIKVVEEVKDLAFSYVADVTEHELLVMDKMFNVNVCLSNDDEVHKLNKEFRGLDKPTNVLSFANVDDDEFWDMLKDNSELDLGDIILSFDTLQEEARVKNISVYAHFCHLLVHGFLHILGFDHIDDKEAEEMEGLEIEILAAFSIDNPYQETEDA